MSDLPAFANLGQEILEAKSSRYFLVARTEDRKDILSVPLALDGLESLEQAVERFKDAIMVSKMCFSLKGEYTPAGSGIDGRPRTAFEHAEVTLREKIRKFGTSGILDTDEWKVFVATKDAS